MAENKKSVLIYVEWVSIFDELTDDEAGKLIKHLFRYVNDINPEPPDRLTKLLFEQIKQALKRDLKKYEAICLRNKENGSKGGRPKDKPKKPSGLSGNPKNPDKPDKDKDKDKDKDILKEEDEITKIWNKWKKYKKDEFSFNYKSEISEQAAKTELINLSNNNAEIAIKIIEQSIANGWKGLFKLKINGTNTKSVGASNEAIARIISEKFGSDSGKG